MGSTKIMYSFPCQLCRNVYAKTLFRLPTGNYKKCIRCGLVSADPVPNPDQIFLRAALWAKEFHTRPEKVIQSYSPDFQRVAYSDFLEIAEHFKSNGRLLDVGCGIGGFIDAAKNAGWDSCGIDISPSILIPQSKGLKAFKGYLEEMKFPEGYFDIITLIDVIEHIHDLNSLMSHIRKFLRPQGGLIIVTPNINSLTAKFLRSKWQALEPEDHITLFSPSTLNDLLKKHNFSTLKTLTYDLNILEFKYAFRPYPSIAEKKRRQKERRYFISKLVNSYLLAGIRNIMNPILTYFWLGDRLIIEAMRDK